MVDVVNIKNDLIIVYCCYGFVRIKIILFIFYVIMLYIYYLKNLRNDWLVVNVCYFYIVILVSVFFFLFMF